MGSSGTCVALSFLSSMAESLEQAQVFVIGNALRLRWDPKL